MDLVVIGTLAFDTIETPYERREETLGGSALHFAFAAAHFLPVGLVGVVGTDFPRDRFEDFGGRGIDCAGVEVAEGKTFRWSGRYEADWNTRHTLDTQLNVFAEFDPKVPETYRSARFVFLANAEPAVQLRALEQIRSPRLVVADTMNLWIDQAREDLAVVLKQVDGIVLNDEEARMLTDERNLIRSARKVLQMGPRFVIVKKGEHGSFLVGEDLTFSLPAYPVEEVVDPTGAGDSFAGGFMGYLSSVRNDQPMTMRRAMLYGTTTASFCVEGFGVDELQRRDRSDVEDRFNELFSFVRV